MSRGRFGQAASKRRTGAARQAQQTDLVLLLTRVFAILICLVFVLININIAFQVRIHAFAVQQRWIDYDAPSTVHPCASLHAWESNSRCLQGSV